jgi:hypothetical protein
MRLTSSPTISAVQATETSFLAELERVVRGEPTTVDFRALLFVAAEVILEGRKADEREFTRRAKQRASGGKMLLFPSSARASAQGGEDESLSDFHRNSFPRCGFKSPTAIPGGPLSAQPKPAPDEHKPALGSPYCADPNCSYCADLRKAAEQLRAGELPSRPKKG